MAATISPILNSISCPSSICSIDCDLASSALEDSTGACSAVIVDRTLGGFGLSEGGEPADATGLVIKLGDDVFGASGVVSAIRYSKLG